MLFEIIQLTQKGKQYKQQTSLQGLFSMFLECFPSTLQHRAVLIFLRFEERFEKLSFRDGLLWTVGLLRYCGRGLSILVLVTTVIHMTVELYLFHSAY